MASVYEWHAVSSNGLTGTDQFGRFTHSALFVVLGNQSIQRLITSISITAATSTYETGVTPRPPSPYVFDAWWEVDGTNNPQPWHAKSPSATALTNNYVSQVGNYGAAWQVWNAQSLACDIQLRAKASKAPGGIISLTLNIAGTPLYTDAPNWVNPLNFQIGYAYNWLSSAPEA